MRPISLGPDGGSDGRLCEVSWCVQKKVCDEENIQIAQDMTALSSCVALLKVYCPRASSLRCACVFWFLRSMHFISEPGPGAASARRWHANCICFALVMGV